MSNSSFVRLAAIGAIALSFALSACGRRGGLDPPPRASAQPVQQQQQQQQAGAAGEPQGDPANRSQWNWPWSQGDEEPPPAQGRKKTFVLDWLLN